MATVKCQSAEPQVVTGMHPIFYFLFFYSAFLTDAAATFLKEIPCVFSVMFMFSVLYISSTGSHDTTIRLWDLVAGKTRATLTNHKKSVRALVLHPRQ